MPAGCIQLSSYFYCVLLFGPLCHLLLLLIFFSAPLLFWPHLFSFVLVPGPQLEEPDSESVSRSVQAVAQATPIRAPLPDQADV